MTQGDYHLVSVRYGLKATGHEILSQSDTFLGDLQSRLPFSLCCLFVEKELLLDKNFLPHGTS